MRVRVRGKGAFMYGQHIPPWHCSPVKHRWQFAMDLFSTQNCMRREVRVQVRGLGGSLVGARVGAGVILVGFLATLTLVIARPLLLTAWDVCGPVLDVRCEGVAE